MENTLLFDNKNILCHLTLPWLSCPGPFFNNSMSSTLAPNMRSLPKQNSPMSLLMVTQAFQISWLMVQYRKFHRVHGFRTFYNEATYSISHSPTIPEFWLSQKQTSNLKNVVFRTVTISPLLISAQKMGGGGGSAIEICTKNDIVLLLVRKKPLMAK